MDSSFCSSGYSTTSCFGERTGKIFLIAKLFAHLAASRRRVYPIAIGRRPPYFFSSVINFPPKIIFPTFSDSFPANNVFTRLVRACRSCWFWSNKIRSFRCCGLRPSGSRQIRQRQEKIVLHYEPQFQIPPMVENHLITKVWRHTWSGGSGLLAGREVIIISNCRLVPYKAKTIILTPSPCHAPSGWAKTPPQTWRQFFKDKIYTEFHIWTYFRRRAKNLELNTGNNWN